MSTKKLITKYVQLNLKDFLEVLVNHGPEGGPETLELKMYATDQPMVTREYQEYLVNVMGKEEAERLLDKLAHEADKRIIVSLMMKE